MDKFGPDNTKSQVLKTSTKAPLVTVDLLKPSRKSTMLAQVA